MRSRETRIRLVTPAAPARTNFRIGVEPTIYVRNQTIPDTQLNLVLSLQNFRIRPLNSSPNLMGLFSTLTLSKNPGKLCCLYTYLTQFIKLKDMNEKMELIGPIFRYFSCSSKDLDRFKTLIDYILFTRTKRRDF